MAAEEAAAEGAGDVDLVASFGPAARDGFYASTAAEDGDGDGKFAGPGGGVAADDLAIEFVARFFDPKVEFLEVIHSGSAGAGDADEGGGGEAAHGGAVGEVA